MPLRRRQQPLDESGLHGVGFGSLPRSAGFRQGLRDAPRAPQLRQKVGRGSYPIHTFPLCNNWTTTKAPIIGERDADRQRRPHPGVI